MGAGGTLETEGLPIESCRSRNSVAVENRTFWRRTLTPLSARNGGEDRPLPAASGRSPPRVAEPVSARVRPCRETGGLDKCDNRPGSRAGVISSGYPVGDTDVTSLPDQIPTDLLCVL